MERVVVDRGQGSGAVEFLYGKDRREASGRGLKEIWNEWIAKAMMVMAWVQGTVEDIIGK